MPYTRRISNPITVFTLDALLYDDNDVKCVLKIMCNVVYDTKIVRMQRNQSMQKNSPCILYKKPL